jgi:hypothetical protein
MPCISVRYSSSYLLEADRVPTRLRVVAILQDAELANVLGDFVRHQGAVLVAALVGLALDVDEDPALVVVSEAGAGPANGLGRDELGDVFDLFNLDIVEPRRATGGAVVAEMEAHPV